ncbi:carbohydrate-binding domain-containing protein [Candidatus Saccharibacteria bacterium]|nr:carbohydrate-binding domain-containing protein [Candidatus Saccharibacteria bacterium]
MKFDKRWLILFVIIVSAVCTTIYLNQNHSNDTITEEYLDVDNGDQKINWDKYPTTDIRLTETITLSTSGTYHVTGSLDDGSIIINNSQSIIRLILDNVFIKNNDGPAIIDKAGDELVIELVGENTLEDSDSYSESYEEDVTGAIYSKADLTIGGEGTLNITANYQDAIIGKDDLKFSGGTYNIAANDDGIRGKDSIYITGGNFFIESTADAIKTTNETDAGKGFILIENGSFNISALGKGIKSVKNILINGGNYDIESYDDAIHSDNYISVSGGNININSKDDGIHANQKLIIDGGEINTSDAYEGLEAQVVTINDGKIRLNTIDDGINTGGGADESSKNRQGANIFDSDENCVLTINGGDIYINSSGDGLDSNGWLYINGGKTIVDGPTNNGNGALDAGAGIVMNGGTVLAVGASGMAESLGSNSSIFNASIYLDSAQSSGTLIEIKNSANDTIFEYTPTKTFSHIAIGLPEFKFGETYTIYLNGEEYQSFTISENTTMVGRDLNQQMMPNSNSRPAKR